MNRKGPSDREVQELADLARKAFSQATISERQLLIKWIRAIDGKDQAEDPMAIHAELVQALQFRRKVLEGAGSTPDSSKPRLSRAACDKPTERVRKAGAK